MSRLKPNQHQEAHRTHRVGWLRATVLGANEGIVSTASLLVGVAALVAGAMLRELAAIYVARGLTTDLANQVAVQLTAHDALTTHARDELGISEAFSLALLGVASARAGGAKVLASVWRVTFWGVLAMGATAGVGALL